MVTRATNVTPLHAPRAERRRTRAGQRGTRVLYIVSSFPCWSETFIVREIHALLRRGADVRIVALRPSREAFVQSDANALMDRVLYPVPLHRNVIALAKRLVAQPVETLSLPFTIMRGLWRTPYVMAKSLVGWFRTLGMLDAIEEWSPDHVHAHWATYPSTAAMIVAKHTCTPFSFTAHAHDIYLDDQLMSEKLGRASFVATISHFNREYLRRRYRNAADARIEIVHCGVAKHASEANAGARDSTLIVSVGRLDEVKGFPTLLDACAELEKQGVNFRCEIIGDGPLRDALFEQRDALGLKDRVAFLGALPSQQVERKLGEAAVCVLASQRSRIGNMDGIPVALMEAMASRTPVVSTAVSGIPELVEDGKTGLLVAPRDPKALAGALRRMLEDETLRARCVEGAARRVRDEFDADTEGERLFGLIRSVKGEEHAKAFADHH